MALPLIPFATWVVSAIVAAWALINGAAAIAGAGMLTTALATLPDQMGSAPASWLNVIDWYMPLTEALVLCGIYFAIAVAIKFIKLSAHLKK